MEGIQTSKQKRVYSFDPNAILRANFSQKYIHYLLPALIKIGNDKTENEEIEKMVKFEVDMALVLSATGFAWSHALKHKLERDVSIKSLLNAQTHPPTSLSLFLLYKHNHTIHFQENLNGVSPLPPLPRPLVPVGSQKNHSSEDSEKSKRAYQCRKRKRSRIICDEEAIGRRLRTLRRILPGGDEMGMCELLSQVESYVVCLELQVNILRTLVDTH